jgi:hypothetical protein
MAALLPPAYRGYYSNLEHATETFLRFSDPSQSNLRRAQEHQGERESWRK